MMDPVSRLRMQTFGVLLLVLVTHVACYVWTYTSLHKQKDEINEVRPNS